MVTKWYQKYMMVHVNNMAKKTAKKLVAGFVFRHISISWYIWFCLILFQESLAFCSEQCPPPPLPPPVSMKALSPSPLARHSGGRGCGSRRSQTSFHHQPAPPPLTPVWKPIPLITKTGPTGSLNTDGIQNNGSNWITITRQHSQPVESSRMLCNCRFCSSTDPEAAGGPTCPSCGSACRSPTLNVCCENYGYSPCSGRRRSQLSPKRVSSVCGTADDFATIAADSMKITGGIKQFKQVICACLLYFLRFYQLCKAFRSFGI